MRRRRGRYHRAHGSAARSRCRITFWQAATAMMLVILLAGCGPAPASILDERLDSGGTIREVVARDRPTAVLVYPLGYCFACAPQIARWQQFEREGRVRLVVVLAKEPSEADNRALAVRRIEVAGVLSTPVWRKPPGEPREYLVEEDRVTRTAVGLKDAGRNSPVLHEIAGRPPRSPVTEQSAAALGFR